MGKAATIVVKAFYVKGVLRGAGFCHAGSGWVLQGETS
jgi:hypothetical protein